MTPASHSDDDSKNRESRFLSRADVARRLGVSANTVTRWAREGRLPCIVTLGGHYRFDREEIEKLARSAERRGSPPKADDADE